jgi:hypothetical protein
MPDEDRGAADLGFDEVDQLVAQPAPVAGHRVAWVVAEALDRVDLEAGRTPAFEQQPVGARGKPVGVGEDDPAGQRVAHHQTIFSPGWLIFFIGS